MQVSAALSRWTLALLSSVALGGAPGCAPKTVETAAKVASPSARANAPQAPAASSPPNVASPLPTQASPTAEQSPLARPDSTHTEVGGQAWPDFFDVDLNPLTNPAHERRSWRFNGTNYERSVDCPGVDATQQPLGEPAYPLEGSRLAPGKRLPPLPLPNELFRVPLQWPAVSGGLTAIGFEVPGDAAGLAFVYRGCLLSTWFYSFGGNGVELTLHPVVRPIGLPALLLVQAGGLARGYFPDPEHSDQRVEASVQPRWLVFAVDEARARLLADSNDFATLSDEAVSLAATATSVSLVVEVGGSTRRFQYDAKRDNFSGLGAFADKR